MRIDKEGTHYMRQSSMKVNHALKISLGKSFCTGYAKQS